MNDETLKEEIDTNQASEDEPSKSDYFPYLDRDEKITAYKRALHQSLDLAVHPDHLKRVRVKLDALEKFWKSEWSKSK